MLPGLGKVSKVLCPGTRDWLDAQAQPLQHAAHARWGEAAECCVDAAAGMPISRPCCVLRGRGVQNVYHLLSRGPFETDLAETCRRHNVSLLAYSPLAGELVWECASLGVRMGSPGWPWATSVPAAHADLQLEPQPRLARHTDQTCFVQQHSGCWQRQRVTLAACPAPAGHQHC